MRSAHLPRVCLVARSFGQLSFVMVLILGLSLIAPSQGAITVGGDPGEVSPANPSTWGIYTPGYIGLTSGKTGTVTVDLGSDLQSREAYMGFNTDSTGIVTVTGAGSTWTNGSSRFYVGYNGIGTLNIENGGQVSNTSTDYYYYTTNYTSYIGYNIGSTGTVNVTGPDSKWIHSSLYVGGGATINVGSEDPGGGNGTLIIENGGQVSSSSRSYLGSNVGSTGTVTVTGTNSKWTTVELYVGYNGSGTLNIENGGLVSNGSSYLGLGYRSGTVGTAIVTGTNSKWTTGELYVGSNGSGTLNIENGGLVSSVNGYIGYGSGSVGSVIVTGAGSTWTCSNELYVGRAGVGTLTVADGGLVTTKILYASLNDLHGNGTINFNGGILDADIVFDSTHGLIQTMTFGSGGTLNFNFATKNILGVGYKGTGTLRIAEGLVATSNYGYLGYNAGSTGTATVTGSGSTWTNSADLYIGYSGSGTLTIENGGRVNNGNLAEYKSYLGYNTGTTGIVTVTGENSQWTNSGNLYVGYSGSGTMKIENGGQVSSGSAGYNSSYLGYYSGSGTAIVTGSGSTWTSSGALWVGIGTGSLMVADGGTVNARNLYAAGSDLHGNGTINVKGVVSDLDIVFNAAHGTNAVVTFGDEGTLNLNTDGTADLGVGYQGTGNMTISQGVQVVSISGYLGYKSGSTGTATITGANSKWTNSSGLYVGYYGNGMLTIENGGQLSNYYDTLGYYPSSFGAVTVTGADSKWTNSRDDFYIGRSGDGSLTIKDGGQVSSYGSTLGYSSSSTGTAIVTGANSTWTSSHGLCVGYYGNGILTIENGGQVSSSGITVGFNTGSTGAVFVTGAGSTWTCSNELYIGRDGTGTLTVSDGGLVTTKILYASLNDLHGNGTINFKGGILDANIVFDSTHGLVQTMTFGSGGTLNFDFASNNILGMGYKGNGTLRIADGLVVTSSSGYLGYNAGTTGLATVTGSGSIWTITDSWYFVGYSGNGMLTIENGGQVNNSNGYIGNKTGSAGSVTVIGANSKWTNTGTLYVGQNGENDSFGKLTIADGGQVMARIFRILNPRSAVNLYVSGNDMLVLGNAGTTGRVINGGKINFYADAFLAAGIYTPISEYAGRAMNWTGSGIYNATGGTWDNTAKTFTVSAATELAGGATQAIVSGQRLIFTDAATGQRVGASFATVSGTPTFSASWMDLSLWSGLTLEDGQAVLSAWNFASDLAGGSVLLAFDLGLGASDLKVQRYDGSTWSTYAANDLLYDSKGIASFTVSGFSGYAITGQRLAGDLNGDQVVNNQDIAAFVLALTDPQALAQEYPLVNALAAGDINGDGAFNNQDIAPFVALLTGGGTSGGISGGTSMSQSDLGALNSVPEPASLGLLAAGGLLALGRRARRRRN